MPYCDKSVGDTTFYVGTYISYYIIRPPVPENITIATGNKREI